MARSPIDNDLARRLNAAAALVKNDVPREVWAERWEVRKDHVNMILTGKRPVPPAKRARWVAIAAELSGLPVAFFEVPLERLGDLGAARDATESIPEDPPRDGSGPRDA